MDKEDILLLHGALGSKTQFDKLIPLLKEHYNVHTLNFEGHGGRSTQNAFSIDLFRKNTLDYLEAQQLSAVTIFGYSMGGYVALSLALQKPEMVKRIVTLGTKFDWTPRSAEKEGKMLNPEKIKQKIPHFAKILEATHSPNDWEEVMHKTAQMMLGLGNGNALNIDELAQIKTPTLIGIGNKDHMVGIEESESAANALANGRLKVLEDVQHPIEKVDAEVLLELIG
jgi:pimeloyl-ACP methyl ester carboxylesterase